MGRTATAGTLAALLVLAVPLPVGCASDEPTPRPEPAAAEVDEPPVDLGRLRASAEAAQVRVAEAHRAGRHAVLEMREALEDALALERSLLVELEASARPAEAEGCRFRVGSLERRLKALPEKPLGDPRFNSDSPFQGQGTSSGGLGIDPYHGEFAGRTGSHRKNLKYGGDQRSVDATEAGLKWLKKHQHPGGHWDGKGFESRCRKVDCGGPGKPMYDAGLTGLALAAFLGYGETHKTPRFGLTVRNGLKYLKLQQDAEGCFGPRTSNHFTFNHAIASLAMSEAYGLTASPLFKTSAQNGVDFIHKCQNPYLGWRYGVRPRDNDTAVTGWMVMALRSGWAAGLRVDPASFEGAMAWLDKVTDPETGRAGYTARGNGPCRTKELMDRFPSNRSESLTAEAMMARIFCNTERRHPMLRKGADLCAARLPVWNTEDGSIDHYYWYFGTLAMFQVGGDHWKRWNDAMKVAILENQRLDKSNCSYGSWDPVGPWGPDGGRVYSTALNTMSLEVYYRYARVFGTKPR